MISEVSTRFGRNSDRRTSRRGFTLVELLVCIGLIVMLIAILLPALRKSVEAGRQVSCLNHLRQISQATQMYCLDNDGVFPSAAGTDEVNSVAGMQKSDWIYWKNTTGTPPYTDVQKSALARYLGGSIPAVFRCPSDSCDVRPPNPWGPEPYLYSYSMNGWIGASPTLSLALFHHWLQAKDIVDPSEVILFIDEDDQTVDDGTWYPTYAIAHNQISSRHDISRDNAGLSGDVGFDPTVRGNVAFCDGHGEFVTRQFSWTQVHYNPMAKPLPQPY